MFHTPSSILSLAFILFVLFQFKQPYCDDQLRTNHIHKENLFLFFLFVCTSTWVSFNQRRMKLFQVLLTVPVPTAAAYRGERHYLGGIMENLPDVPKSSGSSRHSNFPPVFQPERRHRCRNVSTANIALLLWNMGLNCSYNVTK
jgi:hypothetical protein